MDKVALTRPTAQKLRELLAAQDAKIGNVRPHSAQGKYDCELVVIGPANEDGFYPCVPTVYHPSLSTWTDFAEGLVFESNGEPLAIGWIYDARRYGPLTEVVGEISSEESSPVPSDDPSEEPPSSSEFTSSIESSSESSSSESSESSSSENGGGTPMVYVVSLGGPVGCGLRRTEDGEITLSTAELAGSGLEVTGGGSGGSGSDTCSPLKVKLCSTTWTNVTGGSMAMAGNVITLTLSTETRRLALVGGAVCHQVVSTGTAAPITLVLPCVTKTVVTSLGDCVDGAQTVNDEEITFIDCSEE